jgi:DivIVA domain-containing protein
VTNRHRSPHQTARSIREAAFQRRIRGLDASQVYEFLDALADQVQATERELNERRAENQRLQTELQRGRAELQRMRGELDHYEQTGERVNEQVIQMFSQAQLVVEEMVQDVSRDARERIGQARAEERKIVAAAMDTAGEQVRTYARTAHAQMQSIVDSFATEVDHLGPLPLPGEPGPAGGALPDRSKGWPPEFGTGSA